MKKFILNAILIFCSFVLCGKENCSVFLGDSITHGGWYYAYLQLWHALKFPAAEHHFINAGISGEDAWKGSARLQTDVFTHSPERLFILFGMNDVGRYLYSKAEADTNGQKKRENLQDWYAHNLLKIGKEAQKKNINIVYLTPTPYDQYSGNPPAYVNEPGLASCSERVKKIASELNVPVIDLHSPLTDLLKKYPEKKLCGTDRIHPGKSGHILIAAHIFKEEKLPHSNVTVHFSSGRIVSEGNTVSGIRKKNNSLTFTVVPQTLPLPLCATRKETAELFDFSQIDSMIFKAELPPGIWCLYSGKDEVFRADDKTWKKGVDLAQLPTFPPQKQSMALSGYVEKIRDHQSKYRNHIRTENIIRAEGGNPADPVSREAAINKFMKKVGNAPHAGYFRKVMDSYRREYEKAQAIPDKLRGEIRELYQKAKPEKYDLTLVRLSAAPEKKTAVIRTSGIGKTYQVSYGDWKTVSIWGGGHVLNVILTGNPQICFAIDDMGNVNRSTDGGMHWVNLSASLPHPVGGVRSLSVDPRDPDRFVILCGEWYFTSGIFVTSDGGKSYRNPVKCAVPCAVAGRADGDLLCRDISAPDVIYAATMPDGVLVSRDNGETWHQEKPEWNSLWQYYSSTSGTRPTDLKMAQDNSKTLFLASPAGFYAEHRFIQGFFRSRDKGKSWELLRYDSPNEFLQSPGTPRKLFGIFYHSTIMVSSDGGKKWSSYAQGLPTHPRLNDVAAKRTYIDETSPYRYAALAAGKDFLVIANGRGDLFIRKFSEAQWRPVPKGKRDVSSVAFSENDRKIQEERSGYRLTSIVIDPRDEKHWYLTDWYGLWQSFDSGVNWLKTTSGIQLTLINQIVQDPHNKQIVYLGMADNGLLVSQNGGKSFGQVHTGTIYSILCNPDNAGHLLMAGGIRTPHFKESFDYGQTWHNKKCSGLPAKSRICHLRYLSTRGELYAAVSGKVTGNSGGGIYRSLDFGETWTFVGSGLPSSQPRRLWNYADELFPSGAGRTRGETFDVSPDGSMVLLSSVSRMLWYFDKNKQSWKQSDLVLSYRKYNDSHEPAASVFADPHTPGKFFCADGVDGLFQSDDGGRTWSKCLNAPCAQMAFSKLPGEAVLASANGLWYTQNGGKKWKKMESSFPGNSYNSVLSFLNGKLMVGTKSAGAFYHDWN